MLTTEEEAKTKRCQESYGPAPQQAAVCNAPLTTTGGAFYTHGYTGGGAGVYPYTMSPLNCIGSACMAWRWHWAVRNDLHEHLTAPDGSKFGYCGKAGRP